MDKLPKYVQKANAILEVLDNEEDKTWSKTQKELADRVGISLAELSLLLKTLVETGRARKGAPLPGRRGKTFMVHLIDATPFDSPIRREVNTQSRDRALTSDEEVQGPLELRSITMDQLGNAVIRTLRQAWENEEHYTQMRSDQMNRLREFREALSAERTTRIQMVQEKELLQEELLEKEHELVRLRGEINQLLMRSHKDKNGGSFQVREILDEEEFQTLSRLMEAKPGFYRESDQAIEIANS